jgi:ATPase family associated with various cellular activities (AAA)
MTALSLRQVPAGQPLEGLRDPRLAAWRDLLARCAESTLREYQDAWSAAGRDDVARAAAAIGLIDAGPATELPALPRAGLLQSIADHASLGPAEEAVLAAAWWSTVDGQFAVVLGCVQDDAARRYPTLALLALLLGHVGLPVPLALAEHNPLVAAGLFAPVADADAPLRLPAATSALLAGERGQSPSGDATAARVAEVATRATALIRHGGRVLVRCEIDADRLAVRDAVAAELGLVIAPAPRAAGLSALLFRLGRELPAFVLTGQDNAPAPGCVLGVGGPDAAPDTGWHTLDLPAPDITEASACWRAALRAAGVRVRGAQVAELAGRLPLTESAVADIVGKAQTNARAAGRDVELADVSGMLRAHPRHDLARLARRLPPGLRLSDLVLGDDARRGLADLVAHARYSPAALAQLGQTAVRGRAVIALFHGASGTGKTAAAEGVAAELDRDLWIVDLSRVVSKWLGETQRNLDLVLSEAAAAGAVLLFDEADGLFGKRGEVNDARDRYANLEIDHLLQRIELHPGVVVLTSNRPSALDEAFARRIRLAIRFDLPTHAEREQIWRSFLPDTMLADDVTIAAAAREELSGAAIRAAAIASVVAAMDAGTRVSDEHLHAAITRELAKQRRQTPPRGARP